MPRAIHQPGERFGRLVVVAPAGHVGKWKPSFLCRCDCGVERVFRGEHLRSGHATSCGCGRVHVRHGHSPAAGGTRVYRCWKNMRQRCENPQSSNYANYGGRGIRVCERWHVFENFLADMGDPAPGTSIDRIDNEGNYESGNCRWATRVEQRANRRDSRRVA